MRARTDYESLAHRLDKVKSVCSPIARQTRGRPQSSGRDQKRSLQVFCGLCPPYITPKKLATIVKVKNNSDLANELYSAADFEDFLEPRPEMPDSMEAELKSVVRHLAENRWPFRLHATYDETITRALNVYEQVNREIPFDGLHWFFDHYETISDRNIERVKALGGGIAVQNRMAFQGEYFVDRYGAKQARRTPPIRRMLELGVPVGAGTDATRVASYNP